MGLPGLGPDRGVEVVIETRWKQVISGSCTSRSHACNLRVLQVGNRAVANSIIRHLGNHVTCFASLVQWCNSVINLYAHCKHSESR